MTQYFYPTAANIIDDALGILRAYDAEDSGAPTTTQYTKALRFLNYIVTSWQAKGMQVWCTKNATLTLVSGQSSYSVGPSMDLDIARPLSISQAWLHNTAESTDPLQLRILGREEYNSITNKELESTPNSVWYSPLYDGPANNDGAGAFSLLYVWPTADTTSASTYTLIVTYTRPIQDFNATSDTLDFPQEWYKAICWSLAADLAPSYGVPVMYWDRIENKAEKFLQEVSGWDHEEGSTFLRPAEKYA